MGERKKRRDRFFKNNPNCCFCGGVRAAVEIDHQPPKIFFRGKSSPAVLRFPSCTPCNRGSSVIDQVFAFYASMDPSGKFSLEGHKINAAVNAFHRQYPTMKPFGIPTRDKRKTLRRLKRRPPIGGSYHSAPVIGFNDNVLDVIKLSVAKQAVAIAYLIWGKPVPAGTGIIVLLEKDIHSLMPQQIELSELDLSKMVAFKNPDLLAQKQFSIAHLRNDDEGIHLVALRYGLSFFATVAFMQTEGVDQCDYLLTEEPFPWGIDVDGIMRGNPDHFYYDQNP